MTRSRAVTFAGKPHVRVLAAIHAASFQASEAWVPTPSNSNWP